MKMFIKQCFVKSGINYIICDSNTVMGGVHGIYIYGFIKDREGKLSSSLLLLLVLLLIG